MIERFISAERSESPNIDMDSGHSRREEVIHQYVCNRYGR
ncbi:hypothetical protein [Ferrovibrio xuzhouensis]|uniref:Bacterial DNA polymerase III alpha subunit NTPase domain-containing protein n=1 Tax=Ferrovibrio xuzhouensis TaxID=1576914 RepID=A0ABV7VK45_9PROT